MKVEMSKEEAKTKIEEFFLQIDFTPEDVRKIKKLAMKFNIKLGNKRKLFCKNCFSKLAGKTRVNRKSKNVVCEKCGFRNRFNL